MFSNPLATLRRRPITSSMVLLVSVYSVWLGFLIRHAATLPPVRRLGYAGPASLCSLRVWGVLFVIAGVCVFGRLFIHPERRRFSLALHLVAMMVSLAWAVSFDLGPVTTGQGAYSFEAVVIFGIPFVSQLLDNNYVRVPRHTP